MHAPSHVDSAVVAEALALSELLGSSVPMWTRDADVVGDDGRGESEKVGVCWWR